MYKIRLDWPKIWLGLSPKQKCPQLKCHKNCNVTRTEMSLKLKIHQNMSEHLKFYQTEMSTKLKYHQNWNFTKTEMSLKLEIQKTKMIFFLYTQTMFELNLFHLKKWVNYDKSEYATIQRKMQTRWIIAEEWEKKTDRLI